MWWSRSIVLQGKVAEGEKFSLSAYADRVVESLISLIPALVNLWHLDVVYKAVDVISMVPKIGLEGGETPPPGSVEFDVDFRASEFSYPDWPSVEPTAK